MGALNMAIWDVQDRTKLYALVNVIDWRWTGVKGEIGTHLAIEKRLQISIHVNNVYILITFIVFVRQQNSGIVSCLITMFTRLISLLPCQNQSCRNVPDELQYTK